MNKTVALNLYAGLSELRSYFTFTDTEAIAANDDLRGYLEASSRAIDRYTRKKFYPHKRSLFFDYPADGRTLKPGFFLEVLSLTANNGEQDIPREIVLGRCGCEWNITPYNTMELSESSGSFFRWSGTKRRSIEGSFLLGFRSDYTLDSEAWIDTGAVLTASLASSGSIVTSDPWDGTNEFGFSPRFSQSQIWRLGSGASQELIVVTDTAFGGSGASTAVVRGVNGTTAASHASGTIIYQWNPEPEIKMATLRLARWMYEVRNNPTGQRHFFPQFGGFELADSWPKDITQALKRYVGIDIATF